MKKLCALDLILLLLVIFLLALLIYSVSKKEGFMFKSDMIEPRLFLQPCQSF